MSLSDNLEKILKRFEEIESNLADASELSQKEYVKLTKEYSDLEPVVAKIKEYNNAKEDFEYLDEVLHGKNQDKEMQELAEEEYYELKRKLPELEQEIKLALLPKDEADSKNAIIEIRAGTGGEEAALFAFNLFRMYQRYAELKNWKIEILNTSETEIGGYKEISAIIKGENVFKKMKYESGVHRVQRVPETETGGRLHTSTATVAVLPEAEEVDIEIQDKDLRVDTFRASGAGGQHVNTTDSAVRVTHLPTGVIVSCQDEKSQHKNRAKAFKILRSRLYEAEREQKEKERSSDRKSQVGTGERSERIRTYNFPQGRVSDHRINLTLYKINEIVNEGHLDEVIDALASNEQAEKLAEIGH